MSILEGMNQFSKSLIINHLILVFKLQGIFFNAHKQGEERFEPKFYTIGEFRPLSHAIHEIRGFETLTSILMPSPRHSRVINCCEWHKELYTFEGIVRCSTSYGHFSQKKKTLQALFQKPGLGKKTYWTFINNLNQEGKKERQKKKVLQSRSLVFHSMPISQ